MTTKKKTKKSKISPVPVVAPPVLPPPKIVRDSHVTLDVDGVSVQVAATRYEFKEPAPVVTLIVGDRRLPISSPAVLDDLLQALGAASFVAWGPKPAPMATHTTVIERRPMTD